MVDRTQPHRLDRVVAVGTAVSTATGGGAGLRPDAAQHLHPVHPRHPQIQQHRIRLLRDSQASAASPSAACTA